MNHPQPHDITALAYGLVSGPEREQMLAHLAECHDCREAYDAAFDEQAAVREAMFTDVRSGEAEARALDRTLAALANASLDEDRQGVSRPVGRLLTLPRPLRYAAAAAAMILFAVGVFALVQASTVPATSPATGGGMVADNIGNTDTPTAEKISYASARLASGEIFAQDEKGVNWLKTELVPLNTWVRAGDENSANLRFADGAIYNLTANTVFKLETVDSGKGGYKLFLRSGSAQVEGLDNATTIQTERGRVLANAGSTVDIRVTLDDAKAGKLAVKAVKGQLFLVGENGNFQTALLEDGESAEVTPTRAVVQWSENGKPCEVRLKSLYDMMQTRSAAEGRWILKQARRFEEAKDMFEFKLEITGDLKDYEDRIRELKLMFPQGGTGEQRVVGINVGGHDAISVSDGEGLSVTVILMPKGDRTSLVATIVNGSKKRVIEAENVAKLMAAAPEVEWLLMGLRVEKTADGYRLSFEGLDDEDDVHTEGKKFKSVDPVRKHDPKHDEPPKNDDSDSSSR